MKYANLIYSNRAGTLNIGDDIQLIAINNIYKHMGISEDEIVRLEWKDVYSYKGEKLILPISFPIYSIGPEMNIFCFSEDIIPVFLGISMHATHLNENDVEYLRRWSPIGCRDYRTCETMKRHGIDAYVFGCVTLTLPQRPERKGTKVYLVDVSSELEKHIPENIKRNAAYCSDMFEISEIDSTPEEYAKKYYNSIFESADFVITSRLHMALPCIATGIRTIFARDDYGYVYKGIDRVVHVYSAEEYSDIDWDGQSLKVDRTEYERIKEEMTELCIDRIRSTYQKYACVDRYEQFMEQYPFESRDGSVLQIDFMRKYFENHLDHDADFSYILWGCTQVADLAYDMIRENYPNGKLVAVVDKYKRVEFKGKQTQPKEEILKYKDAYVILCTNAARSEAISFFKENDIKNYYLHEQPISRIITKE